LHGDGSIATNLVNALKDEAQFTLLHLALGISSFLSNEEEVFWHALSNIDKTGTVFGHAIVAAAKTFDLDRLSYDILDAQIVNGHIVYNQLVDGIFEEVSLVKNKEELLFYIFSADGGSLASR